MVSMAADPTVSTVITKLLSLDTPVSRRVLEIALLLGLIVAAAYVREHSKDPTVLFATGLISVGGSFVLLMMVFLLAGTVVANAKKDLDKK